MDFLKNQRLGMRSVSLAGSMRDGIQNDYLDRARVRVPSELVRAPRAPVATTSLDLADTFSQPAAPPIFDDASSAADDVLSYRSSSLGLPGGMSAAGLSAELHQSMHSDNAAPRDVTHELPDVFERALGTTDGSGASDKQFFVLSAAGKPVFTMHGQEELVMGLMGIVHTVVNYFRISGSSLNSLVTSMGSSGQSTAQRFVFLDRPPLLLMAMSAREESQHDLAQQLDFLYSYFVSSMSRKQLSRLFARRENFDLRSFLMPADFDTLHHICDSIANSLRPELLVGALRCLPLRKSVRQSLHTLMLRQLQDADPTDVPKGCLLYGLIVAPGGQLCSVLRPKGHTLHTTDLHLLFSLVFDRFQNLQPDQELWVPVCFPKFNSSGFLHCYIKLLPRPGDDLGHATALPDIVSVGSHTASTAASRQPSFDVPMPNEEAAKRPRCALVLISAQKEGFFAMKTLAQNMLADLEARNLLKYLYVSWDTPFSMASIPAPLVNHFIYKSKRHVQYYAPPTTAWVNQFSNDSSSSTNADSTHDGISVNTKENYYKTLMRYYSHIRANAVAEDGKPFNRSTISFVRWTTEPQTADTNGFVHGPTIVTGVAWLTSSFELYLVCNNGETDRNAVLGSAKNIVSWCRRNESRLFVHDGAVF
ncbi:LAMI_0F08702g1_1 [Lachancea mirantina]|uniref:Vacuolar fusion protein MON1 n=1 Tax=Lachancea mirantina TaxID=1230905 RepID=A0A1G4K0L9_9SACH|nr:LAMI_0F08702g1_1 [Lachancea mirantina]